MSARISKQKFPRGREAVFSLTQREPNRPAFVSIYLVVERERTRERERENGFFTPLFARRKSSEVGFLEEGC